MISDCVDPPKTTNNRMSKITRVQNTIFFLFKKPSELVPFSEFPAYPRVTLNKSILYITITHEF